VGGCGGLHPRVGVGLLWGQCGARAAGAGRDREAKAAGYNPHACEGQQHADSQV
jgi:hypothetical protein